MRRRRFIATTGAIAGVAVAGCLGTPPEYDTVDVSGQSVPLVPTDEAFEWYEEDSTAILDARSRSEYQDTRIEGAELSPAPSGLPQDDPTEDISEDTRITTYCVCPHHLSSQRAATLLAEGYSDVYALDEGLQDWIDQGHPVAGERVQASLPAYEVRGRSDPTHAGEEVWVRDPEAGQREATYVASDGNYEMTLHFVDLVPESPLELAAPDYEVTASLEALTSTVVTGPDSVA